MITNEMMQPWSMELTDTPDPRCKLVQDIGVNDLQSAARREEGKTKIHPAYRKWAGMLYRTYSDKFKAEKGIQYAEMAKEWKTLSCFYLWWLKQPYYEDACIDSDLRSAVKGVQKAYSPETAASVPKPVNVLLNFREKGRGALPMGTRRNGNKYLANLSKGKDGLIQLPVVPTLYEAFECYWKEKMPYTLQTAWALLEGHPQRSELMLGIKITLRQQHEKAREHLNEVLECQQMKAK